MHSLAHAIISLLISIVVVVAIGEVCISSDVCGPASTLASLSSSSHSDGIYVVLGWLSPLSAMVFF